MSDAYALSQAEQEALVGDEPTFNYTGTGKNTQEKIINKLKGKNKGIITTAIITIFITAGVAFLSGSNSLLASSMQTLMNWQTDTQHASYIKRAIRLTKYKLKGNKIVVPEFSGTIRYGTISNKQKERLIKQGIEVEGSGSDFHLKYKGQDLSADDVVRIYNNDVDFRNAFNKSNHSNIINFFDEPTNRLFSKFGIDRNSLADYHATNDAEADAKAYDEIIDPKFDNAETTIRSTDLEEGKTTTESGEEVDTVNKKTDTTTGKTNGSLADAEVKAKNFISGAVDKAAAGNGVRCMVMNVGSMISALVAAQNIVQSINLYMSYSENFSKMMAGKGDASAVNVVLNELSQTVTTKVSDFTKVNAGDITLTDETKDGLTTTTATSNFNESDIEETVTGAPIQANGIQMMLANAPAVASTTSLYGLNRTMNPIAKALNMSSADVKNCNYTQAGFAAVGIVTTIATFGTTAIGEVVFNMAVSAAVTVTASVALSFIIPTVAKALFSNVLENITGIPLGEMMARGASATQTRLGRNGSGQTMGDTTMLSAYNNTRQEVIAMEAEIDRNNRSPFDITSPNTFLGSIVKSFLPIRLNASAATKTITGLNTFLSATSNSIASLTQNVAASGEAGTSAYTYMNYHGENCYSEDMYGAQGDIYCNSSAVTDPSTIDMSPDDPTYIRVLCGNTASGKCDGSASDSNIKCDDKGNCSVIKDSDLAKFIAFYINRDSPCGVVDATIMSNLETGNVITNITPIVNDIVDIINASHSEENISIATCKEYVASENNPKWNSTYRYFQRYVEDDRILAQMSDNPNSDSVVAAFINEYETEHPVDNSYSGYLARISGLAKSDVEGIIALAEYYNLLEQYDPSRRLAMDGDASDRTDSTEVVAQIESTHFQFRNSQPIENPQYITPTEHYIIYDDIRNRSTATA